MKRGLPGVKAPRTRARHRRPQRQGHQGADEGHQDAQLARRGRRDAVLDRRARPSASTDLWGERVFVHVALLRRPQRRRSAGGHRPRARPRRARASAPPARTPPWLYEGIAMYVSGDNRSGDAGALISGRGVLRDASKQGAAKAAMSLTRLSKPRALQTACRRSRSRSRTRTRRRPPTRSPRSTARKALLRLFTRLQQREGPRQARAQARPTGSSARRCKKSLKALESEVDAVRLARTRSSERARLLACSGDARASRSRDDPRPSGAPRRRADAGGGGDPRRALVPAARARGADARGPGPRGRAARAPRQVPGVGALRRRLPAHAPAHDRDAAARSGPAAAPHARAARPRRPRARRSTTRAASAPASWRSGRRRSTRSSTRGSASSRSSASSPASTCTRSRRPRARRSRRSCSTRSASPASGTSTPTRRCSAPACIRCGPANRLTRAQCAAIRDAVVESLMAGLEAKGATIDDFRDPYGVSGSFQDQFLVHLREHEPCPNCGNPVRKLRVAGRGTYVCERCQPRPRAAAQTSRGSRPRVRASSFRAAVLGRTRRAPGSRRCSRRR